MKKQPLKLAVFFLASLILCFPIQAQNEDEGGDSNARNESGSRRFWQASLPGGDYMVALSRITSVSKHSYIVGGNLRVTEVVVDTSGNSLARFYFLIPVTSDSNLEGTKRLTDRATELLRHAGERTGSNALNMVEKQYPVTTHAKTVEFRIENEGDLNKLYESVKSSWIRGSGRRFTIANQ